MSDMKNRYLKAGMRVFSATGGHKLFAPWTEGVGLIFMLHQVCPEYKNPFDPNRILRVTPEFLEQVILRVKQAGLDIVSLDEAYRRLKSDEHSNRFVCFTLDDGYRDNKQYAYPIFKKYECPFTIYVPGNYPDGEGILWWQALQDIVAGEPYIALRMDGHYEELACYTDSLKREAYKQIYWWLRTKTPSAQIEFIKEFAASYDYDLKAQCARLIMNWDEIADLASDPLATIGAHTMNHATLTKLSDEELRADTTACKNRLTEKLGITPSHMSYPYGDMGSAAAREFAVMKEAGFKTAVTTRKGVLFAEHKDHLTALPRVSLNGDFQDEDLVDLYLTGSVFALWNGFKRLDVG